MKRLIVLTVFTLVLALPTTPAALAQDAPDVGYITLDDATTSLHYYGASTDPQAWARGSDNDDIWELTIATSCDALVRIEWFDYYPTQDVYELWVDGTSHGTNPAGGTGSVDTWLSVGSHTIVIEWLYYRTDRPLIAGGSYYDITFSVIAQDCPTETDSEHQPGGERIKICHVNASTGALPHSAGSNPTDNITYGRIITIAAQAYGTHMAHGDGDVQFTSIDDPMVWSEAHGVVGNSTCAFNIPIAPDDLNGGDPTSGNHDPDDTNSVAATTTVCHKVKTTLSIGNDAVPAHLSHGDALGACT